MTDRMKSVRLTTPKGVARYPKLAEPDTKFNPDGDYKIDLALVTDSPEDRGLRGKLLPLLAASLDRARRENPKFARLIKTAEPWGPELDQEGNETGRTLFKFKLKAKVRTKAGKEWDQKPAVFDAFGNPTDPKIGGGSIVQVGTEVVPYYTAGDKIAGLTMRLQAVKVIERVEGGAGFGAYFTAEDGDAMGGAEDTTGDLGDDDIPF